MNDYQWYFIVRFMYLLLRYLDGPRNNEFIEDFSNFKQSLVKEFTDIEERNPGGF